MLAVMAGSASDDLRYLKSVSLHLWLFGYEVTGEGYSHVLQYAAWLVSHIYSLAS